MRLGLDIGTNSIGWWLYETDNKTTSGNIIGIIDGGVRIFADGRDPKSKASLAVARREARAMRRRRDRYLRRRTSLMKVLAASGLMPSDPQQAKALEVLDPYQLRATGLDQKLPITHFGRALFHLNQRRGFKSNRKTDRGDNEGGKIKDATRRLDIEMAAQNCRTYGEFLHKRRQKAVDPREVPSVRTRLSIAARGGPDSKEESGYDFYPDRRHLEEEFIALWEAQKEYHPDLTAELRDLVFEKIFYQRPLKQPKVGLCLFTAEERLPKAHPLFQRRVLYETVNQLRITEDGNRSRPLTLDERNTIIYALDNKKPAKSLASMSLKFAAIGKILKLRDTERFTLDAGSRDTIACDAVRAIMTHPDVFGSAWSTLDWERQWQVISRIRDLQAEDEFKELVAWLISDYGLDPDNAKNVANANLPDGHGRLGLTATQAILEKLEADVCTYSTAVELCGWHHSDSRTGECLDQLPYYGEVLDRHVIPGTYDENDDEVTRYGRVTNPTVHIGLNQLRKLVNKIIEVYGKPSQIVVELARELTQSDAQKQEAVKGIRQATDEAIRRGKQLEELGQPNIGSNRMLLRLWEDLGPAIGPRCCPYTGAPISVSMLFNGSCDVDHILPYSRTLDDSFANRTVCLKEANRQKGNKTPWEMWGGTDQWDTIAANLKNLPENKRKRFSKDAMERFEGDNDFLDRALVDTQYLSRISRTYLDTLYTEGGHVWTVNGRMTEMLRRHWGLNGLLSDKDRDVAKTKNRTDHRHHAIDAAVIAATDRSLIKKISDAARRGADAGQSAELITKKTPPPWETFRSDIATKLNNMIVSHRLDHGRIDPKARKIGKDTTAGQLHNDTAYGVIDDSTVASRTPLMSLKPSDIEISSTGKNIRDPKLQHALQMATNGKEGKDFEQALADFASKDGPYKGIRRVRLVETLQKSARVEIGAAENGKPLKAYKGDSNHCYELWKMPDGEVQHSVITTFDAHQGREHRHPAAKRIARFHKGDTVRVDRSKFGAITATVAKFSSKGNIELVPHNEANASDRYRTNKEDLYIRLSAKTSIKAGLRRVLVDEIGRVRDPGPPKA
ncbi:type II CRISPR RNA-guided endonuclease Cas9 [Roseovarius sp. 10]|uniref:type II CRISPR RNA-guided endonuclease Cas9 n=1 Tax=Roseovarius sp. 10 TaxID=3080563 RepID=UPI0029532C42|nr:type II CRISPR RNA-guided endonuclease Cas9 [Roseovarius sp. 10]MDV7201484.1 type II CRISPR RNA-guided endonuclease Cas9 [Roseovarius sp. 10]